MAYSPYQKLTKKVYDGPSYGDIYGTNKVTAYSNPQDTMKNTTGNTYIPPKQKVYDGPSYGDIANANKQVAKTTTQSTYDPNVDDYGQATNNQATTPTTQPTTQPSYTQQLENFQLPTMPTAPTMQNAMSRDEAQKLAQAYQNAVYAPIRDQANNSLMQNANQLGRLEFGGKQTMYDLLAKNNQINNQQSADILQYAENMLNNERNYTNQLNDRATQNWRYGVDDARYGADFDYRKLQDLLGQSNIDRQFDYTKGVDDRNFNYQKTMDEANLTGMYNGQRTMAGQQLDWGKTIDEAGLTGNYNGNRTLQGQQVDYGKTQDALNNARLQSEQLGYVTPAYAKLSGLKVGTKLRSTVVEDRNYALAKKGSSGRGGGGSSGGRRSSGGSYSSSSNGPTSSEAKFKNELHNQQARYKYFRSKGDLRAQIEADHKRIKAKIGEEGYQSILNDVDRLADNFMGSVWQEKHITGRK